MNTVVKPWKIGPDSRWKFSNGQEKLVGPDFVVGIRMNAREWGPDTAITLEEGVAFARMFEAVGADFIQSSGYGYGIYDHCALPDLVL